MKKSPPAAPPAGRPSGAAPSAGVPDERTPAESLAAGVAHDLNNLLTTISGFSDLILSELPPDSPLRHDLGEIASAAQRVAALGAELQAFSARTSPALREFDMHELLARLAPGLAVLLGPAITLSVRPDARRFRVLADDGAVARVIEALALAARDAMPRGGRLILATRDAVAPGADGARPPGVALDVLDDGTPVTAAQRARLFEPYFAARECGRGAGLTLALAERLARHCGGALEARDAGAALTAITLRLPAARPATSPAR